MAGAGLKIVFTARRNQAVIHFIDHSVKHHEDNMQSLEEFKNIAVLNNTPSYSHQLALKG